MDHFTLRGGVLHAEDVSLAAIATSVGTPVYVYSRATLARHARVFREAHHITGAAVKLAESRGVALDSLPLADLQAIDPRIDERVFAALSVEASVAARASHGGTAPDEVRKRVAEARSALGME